MKAHKFERRDDESLIIIPIKVNTSTIKVALDTGASHTVIDATALFLAGVDPTTAQEKADLETANGVVEAEIVTTPSLSGLGLSHTDFQLHSYDFLANGILSDIDGVLGLDFLAGCRFCVDLVRREILVRQEQFEMSASNLNN